MELVTKKMARVLGAVSLISMFLPFITVYAKIVADGKTIGPKVSMGSASMLQSFYQCGFFVFIAFACAVVGFICECMTKYKITPILYIAGLISTLISPSSIFHSVFEDYEEMGIIENGLLYDDGQVYKLITGRSAGFVILLICFILLILISLVRIGLSSNASTSSSSDSTDDSKVDLNK